MFKKLLVLLVAFSLVGTQNVYALRPEATAESPVAGEISDDLKGGGDKGGQRTWVTGPYTPSQLLDAAAATQLDLEQAGRENRIFAVLGDGAEDLAQQVKQYAAERITPARQLLFLEDKEQKKLVERLRKAADFHKAAIDSITDEDRRLFTAGNVDLVKEELLKNTRHAIVLDETDNPFFYVKDLDNGDFICVSASSGTYLYDGFRQSPRYETGARPQSIYIKLALIEGYMALNKSEAQRAYRTRLLHEMLELQSGSKSHREEAGDVKRLIAKNDKLVYTAWKKNQEEKGIAFSTIVRSISIGNEVLTHGEVRTEIDSLKPAEEGTYGLILSRDLVFEDGLGAILPAMARNLAGKARIAVIVEPADVVIIDKLNLGLDEGSKIITYVDVDQGAQDMKTNYKVSRVKYLVGEAIKGLSFANVDEVVVIKEILDAIGKIKPLLSNPDFAEEFQLAVMILQQA